MSTQVFELAEQIKEKGQRSTAELPALLQKAEALANDKNQDSLTRALAYRAAGNALQILNQFQLALDKYDSAISLLELLNEQIELGRTLHAKVGLLFSLSRFDDLFECSSRAREIFELSGDRRRLARLDVNLAHAYHRMGQHVEALACSERALPVLEEINDAEGFVAAAINSAVTLTSMHEFERAEERYEAAMRLANQQNLASWLLLSRYNLAYLRYLRGETAEALKEFEAVRTEYEKANDEWLVCQCWLDEAEVLLEIGDFKESIQCAMRARVLAKKLGLNSEMGKSLLFEAVVHFRTGHNDEAVEILGEAARRFAKDDNNVLTAVSRLQAAMFRGDRGNATALIEASSARSLLRDSGLPHRLALADIVIGRIQRGLGDVDCAIDSFKSALELAESSRSKWMQYHALAELGLSFAAKHSPDSADWFMRAESMLDSLWNKLGSDELKMAFLTDRENVYTHLVRTVAVESPESAFGFSEKARSRVLCERLLEPDTEHSLQSVRTRLSSDETLVEYFVAGNDLYIFVVRADALVCIQRHGVVSRLRVEWSGLERHFSSCSVKWEKLAQVREHLQETALSHLYNLHRELVAPVAPLLQGSLIFAPYGFLHNIPLHALYDGQRFLGDDHPIAYTPSAVLYCTPARADNFSSPLFVAFSRRARSGVDEVENAAAQFKDAQVLIDPTLAEMRVAFDEPRSLVHIAGHAGIDAVDGQLSWIETGEGRLTSRDLIGMRIRAKTLVVTGCQTARRMIQPGDEWLGLMRSLYLAGASTIVTAFWDIREESVRRLSSHFYRYFNGNNAPAAIQKASASVRSWHQHPYFWAGFGTFVRKSH